MTRRSSATPAELPNTGLRLPLLIGTLAGLALFAVMGAWAQATQIDGAVATSGQAVVRGKPKMVQSLDGGVVEEIDVANGDLVAAGQVLMRLDPTLLKVNLDIVRTRLSAALARRARLAAEDEGLSGPDFTYDPLPFARPDTTQAEEGQLRIFNARKQLDQSRRARLAERLAQFQSQIDGTDAAIAAREEQLGYIERELANTNTLHEQGLVRESQLLQLQRTRSEMKGALAQARADRAGILNSIKEAEIEVEQAEQEFHEEVVTDLRTTQAEIEELILQIVTTSRQLERVEIRAPADGIVHEMQVTTLGGVVAPGGTILQVIPVAEGVEFELMLDPKEIDQVYLGQKSQVIFAAFDHRSTPRLMGEVTAISPTAIPDPTSGRSYYRLDVTLIQGELDRLNGARIIPGMPIEAFLETGERSVITYLIQPLTSQIMRAFRES